MADSVWQQWFGTRRWRVAAEVTGTHGLVTFDAGAFVIELPGYYESPLSRNRGLRGVLLQEVTADGEDIPGSAYPFGDKAVARARTEFGALA